MSLDLTPTTELEAVNVMRGAISEGPVSSLEGGTNLTTAQARTVLHEISRAIQSKGWHFNSEENYPLVRNTDGEIVLPSNILGVDLSVYRYPTMDVIQRGNRLYDKKGHTYKFNTDLVADIVSFLPFEELPEPHRRFITIKAARTFVDRMVGDNTHHTFTLEDEKDARAALEALESAMADVNLGDEPGFARVTRRYR